MDSLHDGAVWPRQQVGPAAPHWDGTLCINNVHKAASYMIPQVCPALLLEWPWRQAC